jgi:type I restriction enzyme S subunit
MTQRSGYQNVSPRRAMGDSTSTTLGAICLLTKGTYPTEKTTPGPYPLIVTAELPRTSDSFQLEGEAVCIPVISSTGHGHASLKRVHYARGQFAVANLLVAAQPRAETPVDARWLWLYKDSLIVPLMRGTANVSLKPAQLADVPIDLPPLADQRRIVDLISALDDVAEVARDVAERVRRAGDGVRQRWFDSRLDGAVPLAQAVEITNGRLRSPKNATGPHMTRYIRTANVQDGLLQLDEPMYMNFSPSEQVKYRLQTGDVMVTEGSGSRTAIGASCRWQGEVGGVICFQNHLLRLRPKATQLADPAFVYQWALWSHRSGRFAELATGTNILSLGVGRVASMAWPEADQRESAAFVEMMESFESHEMAAHRCLGAAMGARAALLADLLPGDHAIPDSYDRFLDGAA